MSDQPTTLTAADIADFKKIKAAAVSSLEKSADNYQEFIGHLQEIHRRELWRAEAESMKEFLDAMASSIGGSRQTFYRKLRVEEIRFHLAKKLQSQVETPKAKSLAKTIKNMSPNALLAAGKAAPEERIKVLSEAVKSGTVTAKKIEMAIETTATVKIQSSGRESKDKTTWPNDDTPNGGTPIPPPAWEYWDRRNYVQPWLTQISGIKCSIEKALKDGDALFAWIGNPAIDFLSSSYAAISNAKLYAVCTDCQGWAEKKGGCQTCHNTGLISRHQYEVCSKREVKDMRERAKGLRL